MLIRVVFYFFISFLICSCGEKKEKTQKQAHQNLSVLQKKEAFYSLMIPMIESENLKVHQERQKLKEAIQNKDTNFLMFLKQKYKIQSENLKDALLLAVDEIPLELVLAQSANESQWGTSRFAVQGNNYFGQWCFTKNCGIVPHKRSKGKLHEVKVFKSVKASIASYIHNINTHKAYKLLRNSRSKLRKNNQELDAVFLAEGLILYSERKQEYVKEIQSMIRYNHKIVESLSVK